MAGEPSDDLARDVIDCYLGTVRVVEALGRAYGFKTLFFWQPVGWHKNPLSDFEKKVFKWEEKRREWILQVYGEAARRLAEVPSVHDIQTLFADDERTLYFDMMHLTETGLRAVEARLRVEVLRVLKD